MDDDGRAIRAAVKSHLDGNPEPRPEELVEWNALRKAQGIDEFVAVIAVPSAVSADGFDMHAWSITEPERGKVRYEPAGIEIVP